MNFMDRFRDLLLNDTPDIALMRSRVFRRAPQVVWVTQRGETVVFDVERGSYESLNEIATTAWNKLSTDEGATFDVLLRAISDEYELPPGVPADQPELDLAALLRQLEKRRVIVSAPLAQRGYAHA